MAYGSMEVWLYWMEYNWKKCLYGAVKDKVLWLMAVWKFGSAGGT